MVSRYSRKRLGWLVTGGILCFLTGCDLLGPDGPSGPGWLQAELLSPGGAESAAVLELVGGRDLSTVVMEDGDLFFEQDGNTLRVVAIMDTPGSIRFDIRTQDVAKLPSVTIVQVADGDNRLRVSVSGYRLAFTKVPDSEGGAS